MVGYYATALNAKGQVVGYTGGLGNYIQWGFKWSASEGMTFFGSSFQPTYVLGISNSGQIVGEAGYSYWFNVFATTWNPNKDLNPPGTDEYRLYNSLATGINDIGQVVGWATTKPVFQGSCYWRQDLEACPVHASLWAADGTMRDLGTLAGDVVSAASKINFYGLIVGSSGNAIAPEAGVYPVGPLQVIGRPFIWTQSNGMTDLNTLIPASSGWVLKSATDINAWGQIVGQGTQNDQPHGFLLVPIYQGTIQQPINPDARSVFSAKRGVIPVKFAVTEYGTRPSCSLPATISITKATSETLAAVDESTYSSPSDSGSSFRIDSNTCQYIYNLSASSLGVGTYLVDININGIAVGHAVFALK